MTKPIITVKDMKRKTPDSGSENANSAVSGPVKKLKQQLPSSGMRAQLPKQNSSQAPTKPSLPNQPNQPNIQTVSSKAERALYMVPPVRGQLNGPSAGALTGNGAGRSGNFYSLGLGVDKRSLSARGGEGRKLRR